MERDPHRADHVQLGAKRDPVGRRVARALALGWLAWVVVTTATRVPIWTDERALWREATEQSPQKPRPWVNLGTLEHLGGDHASAQRAYEHAWTVSMARAGDEQRLGVALAAANLALLRWQAGDRGGARALAGRAHAIAPHVTEIHRLEQWMHTTHEPD